MTLTLLDALTLVSAIGAGVIAGTFFAFSTSVMAALGRLPAPQGIAAMQAIDIVIINAWFMTPFLGTALLGVAIAVMAVARWSAASPYLLAGAVLYVVGTFLVTMLFNVPRNNALAAVTPTTTEAAHLWARYLVSWTFWNHVRTVAALAAMVSFVVAFRLGA